MLNVITRSGSSAVTRPEKMEGIKKAKKEETAKTLRTPRVGQQRTTRGIMTKRRRIVRPDI
jgi:hypothetical protein